MFKRIVDSFRFNKSKTPTQNVMLGIDGLEDYIKNINKNLDINAESYQRQEELINDIKQQTTKLINQKTTLVNQKQILDTNLANYRDKRATNLANSISKGEYDKVVADYEERINKIVIEIKEIDEKLSLEKPSQITKGLTELLKLTDSGIDTSTTSKSNDPYHDPYKRKNYDELDINTKNDLYKNSLTDSGVLIDSKVADNNGTSNVLTTVDEVPNNNGTSNVSNDDSNDNNSIFKESPDTSVSSGGYRYQMSSASRKNKYKKSSKKQSITRGGKRKHTRKHHKKGGNKRKHGRKSHKARK